MAKFSKRQLKFLENLLLIALLILSFIFWDSFLVYPVKLFVVLMHEMSHGLAAIISGGSIVSLGIEWNLGGKCITEGGEEFLIASSGYLGSFLFGALIFVSAYIKKVRNPFIISLGALIILFSINHGNEFNFQIISTAFGGLLIAFNFIAPERIILFVYKLFGLLSALYVIVDIKEDLLSGNNLLSDASLLAGQTGISGAVWGLLWILLTAAGLFFLIRFGYRRSFN